MTSHRLVSRLAVPLALVLAACFDELLNVDSPDRVDTGTIEDPHNAQLLVSSAIADFECAFASYIAAAGLLGEELADGQRNLRLWDYDRRSIDSAGSPLYAVATCEDPVGPGIYQTLQTARFTTDQAIELLGSPEFVAANVPNRTTLIATMAAYSGYSHLLLGEAMCSAAIDGGPELEGPRLLELAEQRFSLAIQTGESIGGDARDVVSLALVGRARTRLDLGRSAEAVADARLVPPGFQKDARYSGLTLRSSNRIWTLNNRDARISVEQDFWNVTHMNVADPRIPVQNAGRGAVNQDVPLWIQRKYPSRESPIPIARYAEAQLIIAEVEGGNTAVDIINALHSAAGLPRYTAGDPDSILRHVIEERELEFFLESHHFSDKLRFNRLLDPDPLPDTPPAGTSFITGGVYGATRCLPLPDVERLNNPNIP